MNYYRFFYVFLISVINALFSIQGFRFIPIKFGNKINNNNEFAKTILLKKESETESIINQIDGFFGIIGPDVSIPIPENKNNLFDLFSKNGVLQGVFISNGTIHFLRKYIKTEKRLYEERFGEIPIHPITLFLFEIGNKFKMLPNIFGLANTALLNYQNKVYVLNERDLPYEIEVNFLKREIKTKQKLNLGPQIYHFLAHPKIKDTSNDNLIETLDYSIFSKKINWFQFDKKWNIKKQIQINKKYISMVHDFISLENHILFIDCPLKMKYDFKNQISFQLSKDLKQESSSLLIIEKATGNKKIIDLRENIFLFHFGNSFENEKVIEFYGCFYDSFDFKTPEKNSGKFRKVIVNKKKGTAEIIQNKDLEQYSLDFPIFYKNYTILTDSSHFIIVKNFELHKVINLDNKCINGEASIIEIDGRPYLIFFTYKETTIRNVLEHYLCLYGIETNDSTFILIPFNLTFGFHSIFLNSDYLKKIE
jgi:hypothetical protein